MTTIRHEDRNAYAMAQRMSRALTIEEMGAMAAARHYLEALAPDLRAEVLREQPEVAAQTAALTTIAKQCGDFAEVQPALDYAGIGNVARCALAGICGAQ